ncbi:heterokaryon incompatibility protein-domain-containing protein, partial [Podospora fimiseda]
NPILINGQPLSITSNLEKALRQLRQTNSVRILWVDAICINQNSIEERNHQVNLMGLIYSRADKVLLWLGPTKIKEDSDFLFDAITSKSYNSKDLDILRFRFALASLCRRPWFTRVWVVQELALSSADPCLICGSKSLSWHVFINCLQDIYSELSTEQTLPRATATRFSEAWEQNPDPYATLFTSRLGTLISDVLALHEVRLHHRNSYLEQQLARTYHFQSSDPRDKVFSLLGISKFHGPPILPDYSKPVETVYAEAMIEVLNHGFSQSFSEYYLLMNRVRPDGWPSWVPDFTEHDHRWRVSRISSPTNRHSDRSCILPDLLRNVARVSSDLKVLSTKGQVLGKIIAVEDLTMGSYSIAHVQLQRIKHLFQPYNVNGHIILDAILGNNVGRPHLSTEDLAALTQGFMDFWESLELTFAFDWLALQEQRSKYNWIFEFISQGLMYDRTLFLTETGRFGLGPRKPGIQKDDILVALFGDWEFPMILRQREPSEQELDSRYYTMVGSANISGHHWWDPGSRTKVSSTNWVEFEIH